MQGSGTVWNALEARRLELGAPPADGPWQHWRATRDENDVAWLLLDREDARANSLSGAVLAEFADVLATLAAAPPKGLVIRSAKPSGFIVGADINEFRDLDNAEELTARLKELNAIVDRLADLDFPTVAVIHGNCLGGGLEVALACDYRIGIAGTRLGFPEVNLGLHPGLGGTARLPRLINPVDAMTLMLTGRPAHAAKARKLGLLDAVTEERHVRAAVADAVAGRLKRRRPWSTILLNLRPARSVIARQMRRKTSERAREDHYPAPYALIDLWETHGGRRASMQRAEAASFADLLVGETAQNLVRVFFLRETLRDIAKGPAEFGHVHVIGAGTMGGDIAAWCAYRGLKVTLADMSTEIIAGAVKRAAALGRRRHLNRAGIRDMLDRLVPDPKGAGAAHADIVIEAVPEKPEIKHAVYGDIEPRLKKGAVLATNTSSIPLETLAEGLADPSRLVGIHFFNPVASMQLVEIVRHDKLSDTALAAATAFAGRIDRLPVPVLSRPGFLVNRALTPYLLEAMVMMDEDIAPETIDAAAERFGMPMGPLALADQVGLDVCLGVSDMLIQSLDQTLPGVPARIRRIVESGNLGRKTGKGIYEWEDGKPQKEKDAPPPDDTVADRLILPMVNTCMACLREGIVADAETLDGAMIFGTGFAPFRGGPLHYARSRGKTAVTEALQRLADTHGARFQPDPGWADWDG